MRRVYSMLRRKASVGILLFASIGATSGPVSGATTPRTEIFDKPITELRADLEAGRTTSVELVKKYLARIESMDRKGPTIRAIIAINPDAVTIARALDRERHEKGARGPMHGIPVLLKDNIETRDAMPTTAGSLALVRNLANRDALIAANLRAAGAIILGKTNLSEWANFRSDRSISGWSGVGGLAKNPHVLDRSACGSSAGSAAAVAARFAAASVGTETDGSITCPASMNGVVGLKPTLGLLAQQGIVPIAHSQDTAGPMTRSVADAAAMLAAMVGREEECKKRVSNCKISDYVGALSTASFAGKRIGVWRFRAGRHPQVDVLYDQALQIMRDAGATLIDVQVPDNARTRAAEDTVLVTEFKADLDAYLASTPATVAVRSLEQLIAFDNGNAREMSLFGQELFVRSNATKGLDDPAYKTALSDSKRLAGEEGISKVLAAERLDFIVAPTAGPSWRIDLVAGDQFPGSFSSLPAISGFPHLTVPMGTVRNLPVGISFIGPPWSEALLLSAGYAYEQKAKPNVRATFMATIETDAEPAIR